MLQSAVLYSLHTRVHMCKADCKAQLHGRSRLSADSVPDIHVANAIDPKHHGHLVFWLLCRNFLCVRPMATTELALSEMPEPVRCNWFAVHGYVHERPGGYFFLHLGGPEIGVESFFFARIASVL